MSFYILIILDTLADAFALHFKFNKIVGRDDHPLYFLLFIVGYISWEKNIRDQFQNNFIMISHAYTLLKL